MVNISDFFKKEDKPEPLKQPEKKLPADTEPSLEKTSIFIPKDEVKKETFPQPQPDKKPSGIFKENLEILDQAKTKSLYGQCIDSISQILEKVKNNQSFEVAKIKEQIDILTEQIILGNYYLVSLATSFTEENYLYAHSVNVCILSVLLGQGLGYEKTKLQELSLASVLHDVGMIKVMDISHKPGKLTDQEQKRLQEHPSFGVEILESSKDITKMIIDVAEQHHECVDGKGYPRGLKGDQISEFAKIVAITDKYEALTHPRSHRDRLDPYEALRALLKNKEHFDYKLLKVLIEQLGVYPIGSYVQLSSDEIGAVIKTNRNRALRPVVRIEIDSQGKKIDQTKTVDLSVSPTIYIKRAIDERELKP
jgi:HD-GYP domain-containing protein (c-di-GMP phosphodiesterase class II)